MVIMKTVINHLKLKNRDSPQLKYNVEQPNKITIFPNDGSQPREITIRDGTRKLLFDIHPDVDKIESEDIAEYFDIYEAIGDIPGKGNRLKNILAAKPNREELKKYLENFNKRRATPQIKKSATVQPVTGEGLINSNEKLMKRLNVLSSAYKAGHTNVLQEMTSILDDLLERKIITKKEYQKFIN